jgi:hypothetical protein
MMYWGQNRSQTQYVPFPHEPDNAKPLKLSELGLERESEMDRVPKEALEFGSIPFLRMLSRGEGAGPRWDWARDKIVLFVGSSRKWAPLQTGHSIPIGYVRERERNRRS